MKAIKRLWLNIPRKVRACINLLAILLLILTFYYCTGSPAFTLEQGFRRQEKSHLVGPGKIVDHLRYNLYPEFTDLLVAETEQGVIFYGVREQDSPLEDFSIFSYREKTGKLMVLAPPSIFGLFQYTQTIPVYLFDDYPDAIRAEMELRVMGEYQVDNDTHDICDVSFTASADRFSEGIFRFWVEEPDASQEQLAGMELLTRISTSPDSRFSYTHSYRRSSYADITVRLYDEAGELIVEEELTLRTVSAEAQYKRGELE